MRTVSPYFQPTLVIVADVYGTNHPTLPDGWEATEFRMPREGENILSIVNNTSYTVENISAYGRISGPRIILKRKQPRRVVFEEDRSGKYHLTSSSNEMIICYDTTKNCSREHYHYRRVRDPESQM